MSTIPAPSGSEAQRSALTAFLEALKHKLLPYQLAWLMDLNRLRAWRKARQIGGSTAIAAECVYESAVKGIDCLICSAAEKNAQEVLSKCKGFVRVARAAGLDIKLTTDSKGELGFTNGHKILSLSQNPSTIRGFSGHLYLDEFSHHSQDHLIYQAGFPVTTRGYRLSVLSTPLGMSGEFYRCWTERPDFSRHDTNINDAIAQGLRVDVEYLRRNIDDESFRQEYLCEFVDEATAYFPFDLIRRAIGDATGKYSDLYVGMDIGRRKDLTVICVLGQLGQRFTVVRLEVLKNAEFATQRLAFRNTWSAYNARRGAVDATGLGMNMAEDLRREFPQVEPVTFTARSKEDMVIGVKKLMEDGNLTIPDDQALISDIHAIRKSVTSSNTIRFDSDVDEHGHADRFWALALALLSATKRRATWHVR